MNNKTLGALMMTPLIILTIITIIMGTIKMINEDQLVTLYLILTLIIVLGFCRGLVLYYDNK